MDEDWQVRRITAGRGNNRHLRLAGHAGRSCIRGAVSGLVGDGPERLSKRDLQTPSNCRVIGNGNGHGQGLSGIDRRTGRGRDKLDGGLIRRLGTSTPATSGHDIE